jgi:hypothetical protein
MVEKDNTKLVNESEEVKLSTKMGKKLAPDRSLFRILMAIFTFISSGQEVQLKQFHLYLVVPWDFQVFQHQSLTVIKSYLCS